MLKTISILLIALVLCGCHKPVACVDGVLYTNVDPLNINNVYEKTRFECKEV